MKKITVIGILFITLFIFRGYSQGRRIDSLEKELNHDLPDITKSKISNRLSINYLQNNDIPASLQYAYLSLEFAIRTNDRKAISIAYLRIGNTYSSVDVHNTALEYYLKSKQVLKNTHLRNNWANTYLFMGQAYNNLQKYDSARICYHLANTYLSQLRTPEWGKNILLFRGEVEKKTGNFDTARVYYQETLNQELALQDTLAILNTLRYFTDLWQTTGQFHKEEKTLKKIINLSTLSHHLFHLCKAYSQLASCYLKTGKTVNAYESLLQSDSCNRHLNEIALQKNNLLTFSDYYAKVKNYQKAYQYYTKYLALNDSIEAKHFQLVKKLFDIRYNTESKIKELELLKKNNDIQNLKFQKNSFYKHVSQGVFYFFLIVLLILLFVYYIKRRAHQKLLKTNKKLELINAELARREQEQQHENLIRNKLFMILAHDLINPFNALLGFAELLSEEIQEFDRRDVKRQSEFILQSAKQLHFLLENLLQWARIQTKRVRFFPSYINMNKVIRNVADLYRFMADKKKISLNLHIQDSLIVYADESLVSVVLRNLIHNALKYTYEGGTVEIEGIQEEQDQVMIKVRDTGCGISREEQKKLFNLEHHFTQKGTSGEQGTGLGLIICKEFLKMHNSSLIVESVPEKGSNFIFSLTSKNKKEIKS